MPFGQSAEQPLPTGWHGLQGMRLPVDLQPDMYQSEGRFRFGVRWQVYVLCLPVKLRDVHEPEDGFRHGVRWQVHVLRLSVDLQPDVHRYRSTRFRHGVRQQVYVLRMSVGVSAKR